MIFATLTVSTFAVREVSAAEPLARVEAEAMIARLSDQQVRDLLIRRIAQADEAQQAEAEEFNPAVSMYRLQRDVGRLSEELDGIFAAVDEFPGVFPLAWERFSADREQSGLLWFVVALVVSMGAGAFLALLVRMRVNVLLASVDSPMMDSSIARCRQLGKRLLRHGLYIVVFVGVASIVFIVVFDDELKDRITYFFYLAAAAIFLASIALSHAVHAPTWPALRLPLYSDVEAQALHRTCGNRL